MLSQSRQRDRHALAVAHASHSTNAARPNVAQPVPEAKLHSTPKRASPASFRNVLGQACAQGDGGMHEGHHREGVGGVQRGDDAALGGMRVDVRQEGE